MYANLITKIEFPDYLEYLNALQQACKEEKGVYEILYKYELKQDDHFCMLPGFKSFDRIAKNQRLAEHNGKMVCSKEEGKIFMPLYQSQGEDGFFIIRSVSQFWLLLSAKLRQFRMEKFLICLPGVSRDIKNPKALRIDKNTARFLAKEIFHLLGFRMKKKENNVLIFTRRERI